MNQAERHAAGGSPKIGTEVLTNARSMYGFNRGRITATVGGMRRVKRVQGACQHAWADSLITDASIAEEE